MAPRKPEHLAPEYAAQFQQPDVAQAYRARPAYPAALFELLRSLISGSAARVLELGAGTGDLTQGLAAHCAALDAVEPSAAMLSIARQRCTSANVTWHELSAEEYVFAGPYALAVAAESLHWMDWQQVLPRLGRALRGPLAIVTARRLHGPWAEALSELITTYSTNRDYQPYDLIALLAERGLFREHDRRTLRSPFIQSVDDYVESFHSRNGLSRMRMGQQAADAFDAALRALLRPFQSATELHTELSVEVIWGIP